MFQALLATPTVEVLKWGIRTTYIAEGLPKRTLVPDLQNLTLKSEKGKILGQK